MFGNRFIIWRFIVKVGDLVRLKNAPFQDIGIVLEINGRFKWAEVYWSCIRDSWAFFEEDLEVISEHR